MVGLEQKREDSKEEKPRIGLVTGASMVKITGVLGLGFIPNRRKEENKTKKEASKSGAQEAQSKRHRLAGAYSVTEARVEDRTGIRQDQRKNRKNTRLDPSAWGDHNPARRR
jgi:hypothetical protein